MAYSPAMRRMNLIRQMCAQFMRHNCPGDYAVIVREAEKQVPKGKGGWNIGATRRKLAKVRG